METSLQSRASRLNEAGSHCAKETKPSVTRFPRRDFLALAGAASLGATFLNREIPLPAAESETARRPVPKDHPRLLGSLRELQALAKQRPAEYQRMARVARQEGGDDYAKIISGALVAAIEQDQALARQIQQRAMKFVSGPIRQGHVPFANDLALSGLAYDLCHEAWSEPDRQKFHQYVNQTVDANVQSETSVFHNGWYGYKNWGIGLAAYAGYHENPRAVQILKTLEEDYRTRTAPALELAGDGGGWAEGYYLHYFLYEWLFFCEVARRCEGVDYYALAPKFFSRRAIAAMFETYPGLGEYGSRRCLPMGDGGGRTFGGDRDKALAARRILVNYHRNDPTHQAVHAFNETTPRSAVGAYAYKDFLWRDPTVPKGSLDKLPLSHVSPGPGYVYARSSWQEDATCFFFKCGDRFTAHQHLDNGHLLIFKHAELAGDGGHYDDFGSVHDVNYHLRSIAHSTVLVHDPSEKWPAIRAGKVTGNDGGQHHNFPHHNGGVGDAADWNKQRAFHDLADLLAVEDRGDWLYVAGDCSKAYSASKLEMFTRQIVYWRPDTFIIFDRVRATRPEVRKTWQLQAMKPPVKQGEHWAITNGKGRLFIQSLLPAAARVELATGADLYRYDGQEFPPRKNTGPAPECRFQVVPAQPAATDYFLHVLTAASADQAAVPVAQAKTVGDLVEVVLAGIKIGFQMSALGGYAEKKGMKIPFAKATSYSAVPPE